MYPIKIITICLAFFLILGSSTAIFVGDGETLNEHRISSQGSGSLGLISYWKMDNVTNDNIVDSVGSNDGNVVGNATLTDGVVNKAMHVDGQEYISIPDDPTLDEKLNESFTLEFWFKQEDWPGHIIGKGNESSDLSWSYGVDFDWAFGAPVPEIKGSICNGSKAESTPDVAYYPNEWHHIALNYDGNGLTLFKDGENVSYEPYDGGVYNSPANLTIGIASMYKDTHYYTGLIDEVALYNNSLSNTTIHNHYKKSKMGHSYLEEVVWVDDDFDSSTPGWQEDHFDSIQDGIDAVNSSTVYVANGSYEESVTVDKSVNLIGESRQNTTINGKGASRVVDISADWVNITGFSVKNGSRSGIYITGDHANVVNSSSEYIIGKDGSGPGSGDIAYGIYLTSVSNCTINDNIIRDIKGGDSGEAGGNGGVAYGIFLNSVLNCTINNNIIRDLKGGEGAQKGGDAYGIYIGNSANNTISSSFISSIEGGLGDIESDGYGYGVLLFSSGDNELIKSDLKKNDYALSIYDSTDNTFYHNNFINSSIQYVFSYDNSSYHNTWDDGNGTGNYWDDYAGLDDGSNGREIGDGVGDTKIPHPIDDQGDGYYQLDNYPLLKKWPLTPLADTPWPMFKGGLRHTGHSSYNTSHVDGTEKWNYSTSGAVNSSATIGLNGTIYVGSNDGNLYALNSNGTERWNYTTGGEIWSSPAVGSKGTIYFGNTDDYLYALNSNGTRKWRFQTGSNIISSPAVGVDGTIYIGSDDGNLYAVNRNGTEKWNFSTSGRITSSPAIDGNGTIYVGSTDQNIYAINSNGTLKWKKTAWGSIHSSPAIHNGTIYFRSDQPGLYAVSTNGSSEWSYNQMTGNVRSSPTVADGNIYVGSNDGYLYSLYQNGTLRWKRPLKEDVSSSPAVGSDGTIYVGSDSDRLFTINPNGTEKWRFRTKGDVFSSPAIGNEGKIYVGSGDNRLYAIGGYALDVDSIHDDVTENTAGLHSYEFTIENDGNFEDTYDLTASDTEGWSVDVKDNITVPAIDSVVLTVDVTIPEDAGGVTDQITLKADSQNSTDSASSSMSVTLAEDHGVQVTAPSDQTESVSGNYTYEFIIENTGNIEDTYDLSVSDTKGWSMDVQSTVTVPAKDSVAVYVDLTIPKDAGGVTDEITLTVDSQNSGTTNTDSLSVKLQENYAVEVKGPDDAVENYSSSYDYEFTIENTGNIEDTYEFSVSDSEGWILDLPKNVTVPAQQTRTINVTVKIPDDAGGVTDKITVKAAGKGVTDSHSMNVTLEKRYGVSISAPSGFEVKTTGNHTCVFYINNTGNIQDTYDLSVETDVKGWTADLETSMVTVGAKESMPVNVTISVPEGVEEDGCCVILTANGHKSDSGNITIQNEVDYGVKIDLPSDKTISSLGTFNFDITIINEGTTSQTFDLQVESTNQLFEVNAPDTVTVPTNESTVKTITVTIDNSSAFGQETLITLEVTDTVGNQDSETFDVILEERDQDGDGDGGPTDGDGEDGTDDWMYIAPILIAIILAIALIYWRYAPFEGSEFEEDEKVEEDETSEQEL